MNQKIGSGLLLTGNDHGRFFRISPGVRRQVLDIFRLNVIHVCCRRVADGLDRDSIEAIQDIDRRCLRVSLRSPVIVVSAPRREASTGQSPMRRLRQSRRPTLGAQPFPEPVVSLDTATSSTSSEHLIAMKSSELKTVRCGGGFKRHWRRD